MPGLFGRSSFNYFFSYNSNGVSLGSGAVNSHFSNFNGSVGSFSSSIVSSSFFSLVAARVESCGEGNSE